MDLGTYLKTTGTTLHQFGEKLGVSHSTVQRWATGRTAPRDEAMMAAIMAATDGTVTSADFFPAAARPTTSGFGGTATPFMAEARALGLDPEEIAAKAVQDAVREEKARRWLVENGGAIAAWNEWTEQNELPLARHRMF